MKKYFLAALLFFSAVFFTKNAQAACTGELTVTVRDGMSRLVSKAQVSVYQEGVDADGVRRAIKQVGTARVDDTIGSVKLNFTATSERANYVIKVTNPNLKNRDFLFYDRVSASCGYQGTANLTLSLLRISARDTLQNSLKKISVTVGAQGTDGTGKIVSSETLGTFSTGDLGYVDVLAPTYSKADNGGAYFYVVTAKNAKGQLFTEDTVAPADNSVRYVMVNIGDAVITVKDRATARVVPNFKVTVSEQTNSGYGGYQAGKLIETLTTDDLGRAYIQLPIGKYYLTYQNTNGQKIGTPMEIVKAQRYEVPLWLDDYQTAKCQYKSDFKFTLRDQQGEIISNINYTLYTQSLDADGRPVPADNIASGKIDALGLATTKFTPTPSQKYLLEVCSQKIKGACFWFANINFACSEKITLEKTVPAVNIILRDGAGKLMPGQAVKIYQQTKNIDGEVVLDKNALLGTFNVPASGKLTVYLPAKNLRDEQLGYFLTVDQKDASTAQAQFKGSADDQTLNYQVMVGKLVLKNAAVAAPKPSIYANDLDYKLAGRILLQVQANGEAWYVDPVMGGRYYLAGPSEAFALMRKLAIGVTNVDLAKIAVAIEGVDGVDYDNDGLPDRLEMALGTDLNQADTDHDGYSDYQELAMSFNPRGTGKLTFDQAFTNKYVGRILLQVEGKGEAWYVNPVDKKRYYLGRPEDAYQLMRRLGLGITNTDLEKIVVR